MQKKKVAILGAGITGLTFAYYLKKNHPNIEFVILEESDRAGGVVFSEKKEECIFEWGPRGVRPKGKGQLVLELAEELGLWETLVFADDKAKKRYLYHDEKLQVLPYSLRSLLFSPYLKLFLKAFCKDIRAVKYDGDETIADFVDRHFGVELRNLFFDSMVSGIWAGDIEKMSISATLPLLKKLECKKGSVIKALSSHKAMPVDSKQYSKDITSKALFSFKDGLQTIVEALKDHLQDHIEYDVKVDRIDFSDQVEIVVNGASQFVDELISTIPAHKLSVYVKSDLSTLLNSIYYSPVAVLNLKLLKSELDFDGFGFLVPSKENSVVLGMVANSNTFPEHATGDFVVNTVMMGGARYTVEELRRLNLKSESKAFLEQVFGKAFTIESEELKLIDKAIPQYELGHLDKVRQIEVLSPKNLTILGNYMYGVSLIDIVLKSKELAKNLIR